MATILEHISHSIQDIARILNTERFCIAYSGGVDSHVLLYALSQIKQQYPKFIIRAIHINHGLYTDADAWSQHCAAICKALSIDYSLINVSAHALSGESPEAKAREVRYSALRNNLVEQECVLTAQHQDDQAETILLQLLRGCGPQGLASMPRTAPFGHGSIARPLLYLSREQIFEYAKSKSLNWVEDHSNQNIAYSRNFLRHQIIPQLKKRWPSMSKTLSRSAALCADTSQALNAFTKIAYTIVKRGNNTLSISALNELPELERRNVIRYWITALGLPTPSHANMQQILYCVVQANPNSTPFANWPGCEIRRYRNRLYAMPPLVAHCNTRQIPWEMTQPLQSEVFGTLSTRNTNATGIKAALVENALVVIAFRQGGEKYCQTKQVGTRPLKKLLQELAIPFWLRDRIPLVYINNELAAIADFVVCYGFQAASGEPGLELLWQRNKNTRF